ncbi:hypothetical protein DSO57_1039131 [Entomophthora muscae]|uniref:Uncharacterized protein n=1 Tax=Entomophthora muscae TaxID=34485 RepID=A0ACC2UJ45_9FUNG|nr:hypothetical protein DSO57_1039131 [Entomophthora muscae]
MSVLGEHRIIRSMRSTMSLRSLNRDASSDDEQSLTPPDSTATTHLCLEDVAGSFTEDQSRPRLRRIAPFHTASQSVNTLRKVNSSLTTQKKTSYPLTYLRSVGSLNHINMVNAPEVVERCMTCCDLRVEYSQLKRTGKCVYQPQSKALPESISICLRCNTFIIQMEEF